MRAPLLTVLAVCAVALLLAGCGDSTTKTAEASCPTCAKGAAGENVWCEDCAKGHVAGKATRCKDCFRGKTGSETFCESCKAGYIGGEKVTGCKHCFAHKQGGPACESCAKK